MKGKEGHERRKKYQITSFSCHKVPEADGGEGDDDKVDGLQRAPALDVLEDESGQGHEDEAAEQDEEQRGEHTDLRLADFPLLRGDETIREHEELLLHSESNRLSESNEAAGKSWATEVINDVFKINIF